VGTHVEAGVDTLVRIAQTDGGGGPSATTLGGGRR
jgi:hypothetical protein